MESQMKIRDILKTLTHGLQSLVSVLKAELMSLEKVIVLLLGVDRPKYPEHATEAARLDTFANWTKSNIIRPQILAKAGFFYTGIGGICKCFYCDGGQCDWEATTDPWTGHARCFPQCGFLKMSKGVEFIKEIQDRGVNRSPVVASIPTPETPATPDPQSLAEENEKMKEQRVCKLCMDADVNTVLLPCGHVVCCGQCAPDLYNCPICRQEIRRIERVFLS